MATARAVQEEKISIPAAQMKTIGFKIRGETPYVQHKFSQKAKTQMLQKQTSKSGTRAAKEARDIDAEYKASLHVDPQGKYGIPAMAFKAAMVDCCRLIKNIKMTTARQAIQVIGDSVDADDGTPLVLVTKGKPHMVQHHVRLETGVASIAIRGMFDAGWEAVVIIKFDETAIDLADVGNLLQRAGQQCGIGEGRMFSKKSPSGMGWGVFTLEGVKNG